MPNPILKQAVVVGAGMGGLTAEKAVAPHFERVIVFDRDALPVPVGNLIRLAREAESRNAPAL